VVNGGPPADRDPLAEGVRRRRERHGRGKQEGERPLAKTLGMVGTLGWLVVIPTLVGAFVGRWLDRRLGTGVTLAAALLLLGLVIGCRLAWKRMHEE
jgi:ATP synthase protein I